MMVGRKAKNAPPPPQQQGPSNPGGSSVASTSVEVALPALNPAENDDGTQPEPPEEGGADSNSEDDDDEVDDEVARSDDEDELEGNEQGYTATMSKILAELTFEQKERYFTFRECKFQGGVKKIIAASTSPEIKPSGNFCTIMGGVSKVFVGELIETARTIMEEWGDSGSLTPAHIREAYRVLNQKGLIPYTNRKKSRFRRR